MWRDESKTREDVRGRGNRNTKISGIDTQHSKGSSQKNSGVHPASSTVFRVVGKTWSSRVSLSPAVPTQSIKEEEGAAKTRRTMRWG